MRQTVRLMLSQKMVDQFGPQILLHAPDQAVELVSIESAVALQRRDIDLAFISREVTGTSTKHQVHPQLKACYDLMLDNLGLKWVHIHSAGADRPVYQSLVQRGVQISTSSGANARVVAAMALAGVLALNKRFPMLWAQQQRREWLPLLGEGRIPRDLPGQTATVVGWGPIGQELGQLLRAVGLNVIAIRTHAAAAEDGIEMVRFEEMQTVLPRTDWLILACPLTHTTRALVNAQVFQALPSGAHLVNVARGEVVVQQALIDALQGGQLQGAFLDVFDTEPLAVDSPLWAMPNVMITPHAAGHSDGNAARVKQMFIDNLQRWLAGLPLNNSVSHSAASASND
jgi:phosphoglycerate dehydrogenase-like enzyme